ncbi:hypothetical protein FNV43_RR16627 [Rhamnella rubrinervis]|uniref:Uncharacterized protein n=1 Tax=Rhamnella rubrinervis TaxID=2594499 RepID=A0A8K0GZ71_9ROSA|nr:hypothetical protein FNV43_RR16627 [Rhamnella rubrinervis]
MPHSPPNKLNALHVDDLVQKARQVAFLFGIPAKRRMYFRHFVKWVSQNRSNTPLGQFVRHLSSYGGVLFVFVRTSIKGQCLLALGRSGIL